MFKKLGNSALRLEIIMHKNYENYFDIQTKACSSSWLIQWCNDWEIKYRQIMNRNKVIWNSW